MRRRSIDRHSTDSLSHYRPTIDQPSTDYRPTINQLSTHCRSLYRPLYRPISWSTLLTANKIQLVQDKKQHNDGGSKPATLDSLVLLTLLPCDTTAGLAQSVGCLTAEQEVAGSILGVRPILRVLK